MSNEKVIIDEVKALKALRQIQEDINLSKPLEEYKKIFSAFVDRVENHDHQLSWWFVPAL